MTAAGIGMAFTLARYDAAGARQGPLVERCRLQRVELEVSHVLAEDDYKRLRPRLIRLPVGGELQLPDPRTCGGSWAVRRTT